MSETEHHGMKPLEGLAAYCRRAHYEQKQRDDRFGRMFHHLNPAYTPQHILEAIGAKGGPMAGGSDNNANATDNVAAGQIFFGQFVDHDITLDTSSTFDTVVDNAGEIANVRTPTLDLDCIYGMGPEAQPYMYEQGGTFGGAKLLTGANNPGQAGLAADDLLRSPNGRAIIGDPRNDENRIISQLQLAMIRFHNHVCQTLHDETAAVPDRKTLEGKDLYGEARRQVTWHYQWGVVNDFLVAICGQPVVEHILGCGREHYCSNVPYIPIEFSVAAYRFGHSMIPLKVKVQENGQNHNIFSQLFGLGFTPLTDADAVVDWHELFFTAENRPIKRARKLDTKLSDDLLDLPFITEGPTSLAVRNLLRGNTFLLPGGEKVAEAMGRSQQEIDEVRQKVSSLNADLSEHGLPLWLYILAEAEKIGRALNNGQTKPGEGLGPVGATIVAETIIGLLELDDHSYLGANRNWSPREEWNDIGKLLTAAT